MKIIIILFLLLFFPPITRAQTTNNWYMAGANPQRTSWANVNVSGVTGISWYRPIEAYIDAATQIVGGSNHNHIYVNTTKGLVVLDAATGNLAWRFDTELPLAHTPTIIGNRIYVAGFDGRVYALDDNGNNYSIAWEWDGAQAGFSTSPLVVNNVIYLGNRDGNFYAIDNNGGTLWSYSTNGPVLYSAAFDNGIIYFASEDKYGYALNATNGSLVWKSANKLPGASFQSWWPVVFDNYVIFSAAHAYDIQTSPGISSIQSPCTGAPYGDVTNEMEREQFYGCAVTSALSGTTQSSDGSQGWPTGLNMLSTTNQSAGNSHSLTSYFTQYPHRKTIVALNKTSGQETVTIPYLYQGTKSGNRYPPVVNPTNNAIYAVNTYRNGDIPRAAFMGWKPTSSYLHYYAEDWAIDEPLAFAGVGDNFTFSLCCDREAGLITGGRLYWPYATTLDGVLPTSWLNQTNAYDPTWNFFGTGLDRLSGYYRGLTSSHSGLYHNHGLQNPLVPITVGSNSMLFTHRSNAIIAMSSNNNRTYQPLITINPPTKPGKSLTTSQLTTRLEQQIQKIITANGYLNPAYFLDGVNSRSINRMYFEHPADLLQTLSQAYPHMTNPTLQQSLKTYIDQVYQTYFANLASTSWQLPWQKGTPREDTDYPPEIDTAMSAYTYTSQFGYKSFYALFHYAKIDPTKAPAIYTKFRTYLNLATLPAFNREFPMNYNEMIMGLVGFQKLQQLAIAQDPSVNQNPSPAQVQSALQTTLSTRSSQFETEHPWLGDDNPGGLSSGRPYDRRFNLARNFMYLTPELGDFLSQNPNTRSAVSLYQQMGPFWFRAANPNAFQEAVIQHLWDSPAIFQAKAWILKEPQSELSKWLDVPAVARGDLFYIQNIITAIESPSGPNPTPSPTPITPLQIITNWLTTTFDQNADGKVNSVDFGITIP